MQFCVTNSFSPIYLCLTTEFLICFFFQWISVDTNLGAYIKAFN
uniref:Uncharacterized protein n=1 Tax=Rhizophora mucronata TaxID=61149 RepID=A0A2P2QS17_RHIMU